MVSARKGSHSRLKIRLWSFADEQRLKPLEEKEGLMRLMKHTMIALVLCALPGAALGQSVSCNDCGHIVPYYRGSGGFVGMRAEGAEEVTFVASCGNVTTSGAADVSDDGMASMLFNEMNGLACDMDDGGMEVAGLTDGGWYWITDELNSAVGSLVAKDVLGNAKTLPADPGSADIAMMEGRGAVFLKQVSTGRVGLLSTIVAAPPAEPVTMCGAYEAADGSVRQTTSNCMLGDGSTWIRLRGPERRGAPRAEITDGTVERNFSGEITVLADMWTTGGTVLESGAPEAVFGGVGFGYVDLGQSLQRLFSVDLVDGAPNQDAAGAGVSAVSAVGGVVIITITDGVVEGYCGGDNNYSATIEILMNADYPEGLLPAPREIAPGIHGSTQLTINCPSAAADASRVPVPDDPFPTDR